MPSRPPAPALERFAAGALAAVALVGWLAGGEARAQEPSRVPTNLGFQGVDPGLPVSFDLQSGRILSILPFDVQFYLQSPVDANVTGVSGRYVQRRGLTAADCPELFPDPPLQSRGYLAPLVMVDLGGEQVAMGRTRPATRDERAESVRQQAIANADPGRSAAPAPAIQGQQPITFVRFYEEASVRKVELSVPAVAPNRMICFEFDLTREVDLAAFRLRATGAMESELRRSRWNGIAEVAPRDAPSYNLLRRRLLDAAFAQLGAGERLAAPPNSYFDPAVNLAGVANRPVARFSQILSHQVDRQTSIATLERDRAAMVVALQRLTEAKAYPRLGQSSLVQQLMGEYRGILELAAGEETLARMADGRSADGPAPDLREVWTAAELDGMVAALDRTQRGLRALFDRTEEFANTLADLDGVEPADVRELRQRAGKAFVAASARHSELTQLQQSLSDRERAIAGLVQELMVELREQVRILGTSIANYETRAAWYVSADAGVGVAPDVDEMFTYIGTNIYFRPVNKKAPLRGFKFWRRFALMVGITFESLQRDGQLQGIIGSSPILVAGGLRINDHLRLSAGAVVFRDTDPNPLIDDTELAWTPYVSLSVDWNVRNLFSNFGGAFGAN